MRAGPVLGVNGCSWRTRAVVSAAVAAAALAGCELKDGGHDLVNGKRLFLERCESCHTLARAGTRGTIGPDLDAAFGRSREDGIPATTIAGVVKGQVLQPRRGGVMPAKLVVGEDAEDVAAYVGAVAAVPGRDTGALARVGAARAGGPPGRRIFTGAAGCGSCHQLTDAATVGTTGPNLDAVLKGKSRAFIRDSIVNPNASIATGYPPGVMPGDFARRVSKRDLDALVAYLAQVTK